MSGRISNADSKQWSGAWRFCFWVILWSAVAGFVPKANADATNQIAELSWLTITNHAPELEASGAPLTYSLIESPAGAAVSTNGVITWMPTEAQGPGISHLLGVVTDGTNSVTNTFTVIVTEENERPVAVSDSYTVSNAT